MIVLLIAGAMSGAWKPRTQTGRLSAGWHTRMSSRLAGKGVCACLCAGFQHPASAVALSARATEEGMRLAIGITAALLISGCSTTTIARLESQPPRAVYTLDRSADVFVQCLIENMGRLGSPTEYLRPDGVRVVSFTIENNTSALYLIKGRSVEVRTISKVVPFREGTTACL